MGLVLSRQRDERVIITNQKTGEELAVCVADIRGDKVRLGFKGPTYFTIDREEIHEAKRREAREAAHGTA